MQLKIYNLKFKISRGLSLIEILVVVGIFAVLGILTTRAIILTIGGSKKAETLIKVRENLNYSLGVIQRQLRNANSIVDACPNSDTTKINYLDQYGVATSFSCGSASGVGFVASGSAQPLKLTSDFVNVTNCSFTCQSSTDGTTSVKISITGQDSAASSIGVANSTVTTSSEVFLRNY